MNWQAVTNHQCLLGESPVWDDEHKRILWTDILRGQIRYFYPATGESGTCEVGQMTGSIALVKSGGIIAALENGFAIVDLNSGIERILSGTESHLPGNRFNDGKCDPAGRFWAGSMSVSNRSHEGSLYVLRKDLTVRTMITGVTCSNGLAWSPDHKIFYYIDSAERNVAAYDYDMETGNISGRRVVIAIPEREGYPDGMTIDTEGMLWIALWGGSKISRYDPYTGKQLYEVLLPVSHVTSCVFGGERMEDIYVTTATEGLSEQQLSEQPLAGCLFVIKQSLVKGVRAFQFDIEA